MVQRTSDPRSRSAEPAPPSQTRLDHVRVLVVEDDDDSREFLTEALQQRGATVTAVGGVRAALATFEAFRADVLVSDIAMPDADGYELIQRVRDLPPERGGATPAIAVTAHTRTNMRERVRAAGYQELEPKPVDLERLSRLIEALAGTRREAVADAPEPVNDARALAARMA